MNNNRRSLLFTIGFTFVLMVLLVIYTTRIMYRTSNSYIHELGDDKASAITADLENYLENAESVLWVAADTVDHMIANGATEEEIVEYITRESSNTEAQFDETYTGLYGVVRGNYVDGVGWTPPDDYDYTTRDWYITSVGAHGQPVIVSPYVDAQTGNVIISIGKSLTDPNDAMALDLTLSGVQEITENISINDHGYGFILNYDGMIIAHPDRSLNGTCMNLTEEDSRLFEQILEVGKGHFDTVIDGRKCTVFVDEVMDQWHLVIVTDSSELFDNTRNLLVVTVLITLIVFGLMTTFFIFNYRYEGKVNRRIEEMKEIEQKKDYEAKVLKLEKKAADTANKAKSDFLADMSHEIRTPINAILGMNEMILRESEDDSIIDYASNIKSAGNTLLSIINTILDFSKIEDGRMNLVPVEFDLAELLAGLVNSISERARAKSLEFRVEVDEDLPRRLMGDDVRISQVIMNLLTNAVKYTEKGSVTMRILLKNRTDERVTIRVEVEDTGIGIKDEDLGKLYVTFERIEEKRNRHIEGTGLGISIVTKLLTMMDSKLEVSSRYGIGSVFGFDLSLMYEGGETIGKFDGKKAVSPKPSGNKIRVSLSGARVLVTDDNEMNLKVASNLMKLFGVKPSLASSGREAVELVRNDRFDIIFLDHMMPGMDGIETLRMMKEDSLIDGIPVIALTANAVVGAKEQYLKAGFDDYLSKPIDIDEMEKIFVTYLPKLVVREKPAEDAGGVIYEGPLGELSALGIDVEAGIGYLGGDEDFYLEIIHDYAADQKDKCGRLTAFLEKGDLENYKILVHSVKSTSRTVGVNDIAEKARLLEEAAGSGDLQYVKTHHESLVESYAKLAEQISRS